MSEIPEELLSEVLSRLPAESLLRFRCVSKSWLALIDSPGFIKAHLNHARKSKTNRKLIFRDSRIHSVNLDALDIPNPSVAEATTLHHPFDPDDTGNATEVLGSCDGLLCLYVPHDNILVWNPSSQKYKLLPVIEVESSEDARRHSCLCLIYGFGYDCQNDDYKVVRMEQFYVNTDSFSSVVKVCSLKSDKWRRIRDFPYYFRHKRSCGVLVNGALHWVVSRKPRSDKKNLIAAFDLGTEEYCIVPQPEYQEKEFHMIVDVLDGRLCVVCNYHEHRFDLWVMEQYGVKESWIRLLTITQPHDIPYFEYVIPIASSQSGGRILLEKDGKQFMWCDLEDKSVKYIWIHHGPDFYETWTSFGSLVQLGDGSQSYRKEKRMRENGETNKGVKRRDDFFTRGFNLVL